MFTAGEWATNASEVPLGQHYVLPGVGRPLPSKDSHRDPQQGKMVTVNIEESMVSPKIALPQPASTTSSLDLRTSSLGRATTVSASVLGNVSRGKEAFPATSPLGDENISAGG